MFQLTVTRRTVLIALASVSLAAVLPAQDPVSRELMKLEDQWGAASMKKDGAGVGKLLSDDFLSFTDKGVVNTKAKIMQEINTDTLQYVSGGNSAYKVKIFGGTGVIIGVWTANSKGAKGTVTHSWAWTDTWMKQADGHWLCIASQSTQTK